METMKPVELQKLYALVGNCGYHAANKKEFRRLGMKFLRVLRQELGVPEGQYPLRFVAGGIAVSGECVLHTDSIYCIFGADTNLGIMYRTCKSTKDFTGGSNNWYSFGKMLEEGPEGLARRIKRLLENESTKRNSTAEATVPAV